MSYVPRKGSKPAALIEYLRANPEVAELGTSEVAKLLEMDLKGVSTSMNASVDAGLLKCERRGRSGFYRLGTPSDEISSDADQATGTPDFCAALDSDGELFIRGAQLTEDGGVLLDRDRTMRLCEYLLNTCGWLGKSTRELVAEAA